jgi:hypothetical protein
VIKIISCPEFSCVLESAGAIVAEDWETEGSDVVIVFVEDATASFGGFDSATVVGSCRFKIPSSNGLNRDAAD